MCKMKKEDRDSKSCYCFKREITLTFSRRENDLVS